MRRKIIFLLLVMLVSVAGIVFFQINKKKGQTQTKILPKPNIPNLVVEKFSIENKIEREKFSFPENLPVITSTPPPPFTEDEIENISNNMGFTSEPIVSNDVFDGKTYIWNSDKESLVVYSKTRKIEYALNETPHVINKQLTNDGLINIARNFLLDNSLINENEISFSFFTFLKKDPQDPEGLRIGSREDASFYVINFSSIKSDIKILTLNPKFSPISVWVLPDGSVAKAQISQMGGLNFSSDQYRIKNYESFLDSLHESIIISLDDGNIPLSIIPPGSIFKTTLQEIELGYLADPPKSEVLHPIFLLKGKASIKAMPEEINATLYLPATENP